MDVNYERRLRLRDARARLFAARRRATVLVLTVRAPGAPRGAIPICWIDTGADGSVRRIRLMNLRIMASPPFGAPLAIGHTSPRPPRGGTKRVLLHDQLDELIVGERLHREVGVPAPRLRLLKMPRE